MTKPRSFSDRFIARGRIAETADHLRDAKKGDVVYLRWSPEAGGWHMWDRELRWAYPFADAEECRKAAVTCKAPWYYAPDPASIEFVAAKYYPPQDSAIILIEPA